MSNIKNVNRALANKTVDEFYVQFFGIEENAGNVLGRQVKTIERPTITFREFNIYNKGVASHGGSKIEFDAISVTFKDDTENLVNRILMNQISRQNGIPIGIDDDKIGEEALFEVSIVAYNKHGHKVDEMTLKRCWFTGMSHSTAIYSSTEANEIQSRIRFDTVEYETDFDSWQVNRLVDGTGIATTEAFGTAVVSNV